LLCLYSEGSTRVGTNRVIRSKCPCSPKESQSFTDPINRFQYSPCSENTVCSSNPTISDYLHGRRDSEKTSECCLQKVARSVSSLACLDSQEDLTACPSAVAFNDDVSFLIKHLDDKHTR